MPTLEDLKIPHEHSILCPKYGPFIDINRHCFNIFHFFNNSTIDNNLDIGSWFQIASGINEVKYLSDRYNDNVIWCNSAIEYETRKSDIHSRLIRELTIFNFIWGGFEAYCDSLKLYACPDIRKRGLIYSVNYLLKSNFKFSPIIYYNDIIEHLKILLSKELKFGSPEVLFCEDKCTSENIVGLKVVYKIRNSFAHGFFKFQEYDEYNSSSFNDIKIINTSSRVLLLSIQMLLLCSHKNNFIVPKFDQLKENGVKAKIFLNKLHLKSFN